MQSGLLTRGRSKNHASASDLKGKIPDVHWHPAGKGTSTGHGMWSFGGSPGYQSRAADFVPKLGLHRHRSGTPFSPHFVQSAHAITPPKLRPT